MNNLMLPTFRATLQRITVILPVLVALLLACCQQATPAAVDAVPSVQPRQLATVYISPTPNVAEQQATQLAAVPSLTALPPTAAPSPTVYVGVFLEAAADPDGEVPILDATQSFELVPGLPTARPSRCQIPADAVFGEAWRSEIRGSQALGCPIEVTVRFDGIVQVFERGVMYFQSNGPIWAIESTSDGFPDQHWTITQQLPPVQNPPTDIVLPEGLKIPVLGFGAVWFGVEGVRQTLGYARTEEQKVQVAFQRFENGALLADINTGVSFMLLSDGTAYGPF